MLAEMRLKSGTKIGGHIHVAGYKIYLFEDAQRNPIGILGSSEFKFLHRKVEKEKAYTYHIVAFDKYLKEGEAAVVIIK